MKNTLKKFAPLGLYLALAAVLVSGGLYIVRQTFDLPLQISLAVIVVGLALFVLFDPQRTRQLLTGRQARYGSNAFILTVAFAGILVVVNVLLSHNAPSWDLTEDKTNSLAPETLQILSTIKDPVQAVAYYSSKVSTDSARSMLDNLKKNSNGKFDFTFVDPNNNYAQAAADKITRDGTIVLKQGQRSEQVTTASEQDIANALVRLDNPGQRAIYFLTGHGEYSPDDTSGTRSYGYLKQDLLAKNYTVNILSLISGQKIPDDALALIIAGPTAPLIPDEVSQIQAYLAKGGALVLFGDPPFFSKIDPKTDPLVAYLEKDWGIQLQNDLVIDLNSSQINVAISASYGNHPIVQKLGTLATIFPNAQSLGTIQAAQSLTTTPFIMTSQNSWGETSQEELTANKVNYEQGSDIAGPLNLAVAAQTTDNKSRVVVIGDADFANDTYYAQYGNADLATNTIDWASGQSSLINLTTRQATQRILVTPNQIVLGLILLSTIFIIPGGTLVSGIVVWIRRKRRG